MRISDWSSDVCSSDLLLDDAHIALRRDVLPYAGPLLRQNERREVNVVGPAGGLVNALIDIHREDAPQLRAYRRCVEAIVCHGAIARRSEEHTSELQSLMRSSYAVFCLKKKKRPINNKA